MWYQKIKNDLSNIDAAIDYYTKEFEEAKLDTSIKGNLEKSLRDLPGITAHRYAQLQEIEAILEYLNILGRRVKKKAYSDYLENYNKALTSRDADRYADGDISVVDMNVTINDFALVRNKWLGITKALEVKYWNLGHVSKLRSAGLDEIFL